jgi:hypothetical protein
MVQRHFPRAKAPRSSAFSMSGLKPRPIEAKRTTAHKDRNTQYPISSSGPFKNWFPEWLFINIEWLSMKIGWLFMRTF